MATLLSPLPSTFSLLRPTTTRRHHLLPSPRRLSLSSRLHSSPFPSDEIVHPALPTLPDPPRTPIFVTLPADAVGAEGRVARRKTMGVSFTALAKSGVEGVVVEVWWGIVEREGPGRYDWGGYKDLVDMAGSCGLKVRAVLCFHQRGSGPGDPCWLPLPLWVLEEMDRYPDLAYSDRFGRTNREYISLGCDLLPTLKGRSPIQVYSDLMRTFRDTFREVLGIIITEIQVGMGPSGELRYPSCPCKKFLEPSKAPELGEFQCYDKHMLASLNAAAQKIGMRQWGSGGPFGAGSLLQNPEKTKFFRSGDGSWNTAYGHFFLEWYAEMLLLHGERLCMAADAIFFGTGVRLLAKLAGIYLHYLTDSHPSELTAGYYNTLTRDGYLPIARMFGRHRMTLCCACFDLRDAEERMINPHSSPEELLRQLLYAAKICDLPVSGENSRFGMDKASLGQITKSCKLYSGGVHGTPLSFNFVRMNKDLFEPGNWMRFAKFIREMSDAGTFQARLDHGVSCTSNACASAAEELSFVLAYL